MPLNLRQVLALTPESFVNEMQPTTCVNCHCKLHESTTGARRMENGFACSDCYFKALGDAVEDHPIGIPRRRVGALYP